MQKDTKEEKETPEQNEEEKETASQQEESQEEEKETPEENKQVDYKQILEEERKRREKAESSAQYHKEKRKEEKEKRENLEEKLSDDVVTKEDLKQFEANMTRKTQALQANTVMSKMASNPDEKELIKYHYENTINPTGDIEKDVRRAKLLANESRIEKEREEVMRSLNSEKTSSKSYSSSSRNRAPENKKPVIQDKFEKQLIDDMGMEWNAKKGVYENEKGITYDPETGKTNKTNMKEDR